jgi:3-methylcrotonyl-CoA carboxylase alpha subunit
MQKVLIANRGEIACRIMASCRRLGLRTVAVYSEADEAAKHVAEADEAVAIGGARADESYLRGEHILRAASESGADAIHPGYGFLAENAEFARAVEDAGLVWIGPAPKTIDDMGDKQRARALAEAAGVPVLPGGFRIAPGETVEIGPDVEAIGFPLLVKAAAGGGGIGMRRVDRSEDLTAAVAATQSLAARAFGDGTVYLERFVARARHVEVQVFGFGDGRVVHAFERECSVQRRFQKIVEETPAPGLSEATRTAMRDAAVALAAAEGYRSAGTVEFVVDAATEQFYFLEMNTRIQVEHPVTEMTTGLDLVGMQIALAAGLPMTVAGQTDIRAQGHAIECRVYAERPHKNFLPSVGTLTRYIPPPMEPGLRIDAGVREGDKVTQYYDPMIAKVIVHAPDRDGAIDRMLRALSEFYIEGVETNLAFLQRIMTHPIFRAGAAETGFVEAHRKEMTS